MENGIIYKSEYDDILYRNNVGDVYMLTEAVHPANNASYDIIVAFKLASETPTEDCEFFDLSADPVWFFGAFCELKAYFQGEADSLLGVCHDFLDEKTPEITKQGKIEVFYTGGDIWIAATYISENVYCVISNDLLSDGFGYYDHRKEDDDQDFPCQNEIDYKAYSEMTDAEKELFHKMKKELEETMY